MKSIWVATLVVSYMCLGGAASVARAQAQAQADGGLMVLTAEGGDMKTVLSGQIALNADTKLKRKFVVVVDVKAPARVDGADNGINVAYEPGRNYTQGSFEYRSRWGAVATEPLTAIEIRAQVFDVFGAHIRTLSATRIEELKDKFNFGSTWKLYSEAEASEMYMSVMYVARARTTSGKIYEIDPKALLTVLRGVASKVTEKDLEPAKPLSK